MKRCELFQLAACTAVPGVLTGCAAGMSGKTEIRTVDGLGRKAQPLRAAGLDAAGLVVDSLGYNHRDVWHRPEDRPDTVTYFTDAL